MGGDALEQGDILLDIQNAVAWMYGDYGGITKGRIDRIRELLDQLERTLE